MRQYTDTPGKWGHLTSVHGNGASAYCGIDISGNVRILTGSPASILAELLYDAFGVELVSSGPAFSSIAIPVQVFGQSPGFGNVSLALPLARTNGHRCQAEVGYWRDFQNWMYVRRRFLDSLLGRWPNFDPSRFASRSRNRYEYVGNNPITWSDPLGQLKYHPPTDDCKQAIDNLYLQK